MGGIVKSVGKVFGYDSDAISEASKAQAAATRETADRTAQANRDQAQAAQRQQETLIAQQKASDAAQQLLNQPVETVDVTTAPQADDAIDAASGRRTKPRDSYSGGGINI